MTTIQQRTARAEKGETHPSGDDRFKMLDASMKRQRFQSDALIEVLHTAQELFGFLQDDILHYVARGLKLPPSRVYGVATFYHFFTFTPKAAHSCVICTGTACYVKGAETLLSSVRQSAAELNAQTGEIGTFVSVDTARCLGVCGLAPLVVIDGEMCGTIAPDQAVARMKGWRRDGSR